MFYYMVYHFLVANLASIKIHFFFINKCYEMFWLLIHWRAVVSA